MQEIDIESRGRYQSENSISGAFHVNESQGNENEPPCSTTSWYSYKYDKLRITFTNTFTHLLPRKRLIVSLKIEPYKSSYIEYRTSESFSSFRDSSVASSTSLTNSLTHSLVINLMLQF